MQDMLDILRAIGGIVLVDLALSGDNALVIGAAAASLPRRQQRTAIIVGGAGAIVLRILLGAAVTILLVLPLLQAIGGLVLLVVAVRLLSGRDGHAPVSVEPTDASAAPTAATASAPPQSPRASHARGFGAALATILVADVTMSLDNVLAVGALASGNLPVLAGGLLLSMVLLLAGSAIVARLIERLPWLLDLAALVLGWTTAHMLLSDKQLGPVVAQVPLAEWWVPAVCVGFVLAADILLRWRAARRRAAHSSQPSQTHQTQEHDPAQV
jgi:YjbE family integral membrane protein